MSCLPVGGNVKTCHLIVKIQRFEHVLHEHVPGLAAMLAFAEATLQFSSSQCDLSQVPEALPILLMLAKLFLPSKYPELRITTQIIITIQLSGISLHNLLNW